MTPQPNLEGWGAEHDVTLAPPQDWPCVNELYPRLNDRRSTGAVLRAHERPETPERRGRSAERRTNHASKDEGRDGLPTISARKDESNAIVRDRTMMIRPEQAIWEFAGEASWPMISFVDVVRLRWNAGALVASDGVTLVALPVQLHEDDVTGPVESDALRAAVLAQMPVVGEVEPYGDDEEVEDWAGEVRRQSVDVHLTPSQIVTDLGVYPRGDQSKRFPPIENLIKSPRDGKTRPRLTAFDAPRLAHIAKLIGPGVLLTQCKDEEPILVQPLRWDDADVGGPIQFHGVDLPWALLMPMKKHEQPERINSAESAP
jgi:hypothetical protein